MTRTRTRNEPGPRTKTNRNRRSRSTSGRSGSVTRPRRRSMPRGSTRTRCRTSSAPAGPSLKTRSWPPSSRSRQQHGGCSSSVSPSAMLMSTCGRRRVPCCRTGRRAKSSRAGSRWFKSDLTAGSAAPPTSTAKLSSGHPLAGEAARERSPPCFLKYESHFERFIAYDPELTIAVPVKLRGGPDEFTLQNLTNRRLLDVAVIAPTDSGFRVGWLDELPTAVPEKKGRAGSEEAGRSQGQGRGSRKRRDAVFEDAEAKPERKRK